MEEEKDVKKIVIHYEDGTEKVIDKGFFCNMKEEDGSAVLEFTMCHVSGREIELIVEGCLQLGFKLGMFDDKKEEDYTGALVMGTDSGERYVAQLIVPAREYIETTTVNPDYDPENEESMESPTITNKEPVPFDINKCELRLWDMEV